MTEHTASLSFPGLSQELFDHGVLIQLCLNPVDCSLPGSSVHGIYFFIIRMLLPTHSFYQNLPYLLRP